MNERNWNGIMEFQNQMQLVLCFETAVYYIVLVFDEILDQMPTATQQKQFTHFAQAHNVISLKF